MKRLILLFVPLLVLGCADPNEGPDPDTGGNQTTPNASLPDADLPDVVEPPGAEPTMEALFTRPQAGQPDTTLEDLFIELLEDTPAGAEVRGAFFSFSLDSVAQALSETKERGVDVQIVLGNTNRAGSGQEFGSVGTLRDGLGDDLTICSEGSMQGACLGSNIQHNKFLLISELDNGDEHVVVQSSGNVTRAQQSQYDNLVIFTGDQAVYEAYEAYFHDLQADERDPDYHRVAQGETATTIYFSPYSAGDPVEDDLRQVECEEGDEIYLAMAFFTDARVEVAQLLSELDQDGCDVNVLLRWSDINSPGQFVWNVVRSGEIDVGYFPEDEAIQLHHKYLVYRTHRSDGEGQLPVVWTGSHNFTHSALVHNDEVLLRIEDDELFQAFREDWVLMRDRAETEWPN